MDRQVVLRRDAKLVLYSIRRNEFSVESLPTLATYNGRNNEDQEEEDEGLEVISTEVEDEIRFQEDNDLGACSLCGREFERKHGKARANPRESHQFGNFKRLPDPQSSHEASYFTLLSDVSRAPTRESSRATTPTNNSTTNPKLDLNSGYYATYFQQIKKLGKGGQGVVHLVRHVLNGEELGLYACKRVAVGNSNPNLIAMLKEIQLLELLSSHPNIVTYHHSWMEASEATTFTPSVPSLLILMEYCSGGSLQAYITARQGIVESEEGNLSKEERIRLFKLKKLAAVHLLRVDEIMRTFEDITTGLGFLHNKGILHCDLKPENVLLSWDDGLSVPVAKISDFGSSTFTTDSWNRGKTLSGTIDYMAPECWTQPSPTRANDQWSLGLILHYLCYFSLPYSTSDLYLLEIEIRKYDGFHLSDIQHGVRHDLQPGVLHLMRRLILRDPRGRLSCEGVLIEIEKIRMEAELPAVAKGNSIVLKQSFGSPPPTSKSKSTVILASTSPRIPLIYPLRRVDKYRVIILVLSLAKISSLQLITSSKRLVYLVVLPSIIDSMMMKESVSLILIGFHFFVILFAYLG